VIDTLGIAGLVLGLIATAAGAAAQAAIGMGFNLFAAPLLALIDPVFVPGPILMHGFLLSIVASWRLRADIDVREVGISACGLLAGTAIAAIGLSLLDPASLPRVFGGLVLVAVGITAAGGRRGGGDGAGTGRRLPRLAVARSRLEPRCDPRLDPRDLGRERIGTDDKRLRKRTPREECGGDRTLEAGAQDARG
jgi:uncharacterized membrane protein YfcA